MKQRKNTQDSIYTSLCSANIPSITSRYIAYQLQIKGNNEKNTNKWTNISNIYGWWELFSKFTSSHYLMQVLNC
jgi:hypothetical protein